VRRAVAEREMLLDDAPTTTQEPVQVAAARNSSAEREEAVRLGWVRGRRVEHIDAALDKIAQEADQRFATMLEEEQHEQANGS